MVRSLSRGQFHVTSAWDGLGPAASAVQDDPLLGEFPLPDEDRDSEYPTETTPEESLEGVVEPPSAPFGAPAEESGADPGAELHRPQEGPTTTTAAATLTSPTVSGTVALEPPQERPLESGPVTLELLDPPDDGGPAPPRAANDPVENGVPTHAPTSPERSESEEAAPPTSPSAPGSDTAPAAAGSSTPAGVDPSRTLVGLLARMWLMRSSGPTSGALSTPPSTPAPSPAAAAALAKDVTATALGSQRPPTLAPAPPVSPGGPAVPSVHSAPPGPPPALPLPNERLPPPLAGPADLDDRWPLSGVGTFLVEVAALAPPPGAPPALPPPSPPATFAASVPQPPPGSLPRARLVFQLVHCPHPIPEQPASRSSCRQRRVGEP